MTNARQRLIEWCRAQQIAALKYINEGGTNVEGAQCCIRDMLHEELIIEGETRVSTQSSETLEWSRAAEWQEFAAAVESRLAQGARDYGDKSFSREPAELIEEIRQELRDVAGWAFVLDRRLATMARALVDRKEFVSRL